MEKVFRSSSLTDMLDSLQSLVNDVQNYEFDNELSRMRSTYATMLRYMMEGVEDPNSRHLHDQLVQQAYVLSDRVMRLRRLREKSNEKYAITYKYMRKDLTLDAIFLSLETHCGVLRRLRAEPNERESIQQHEWEQHEDEHEKMLCTMFEYLWVSDVWHRSDYERATEILNSDVIFNDDKSLFVSAVTLSLMECFDQRKLMLLFDAYLYPSLEVSQRSIVGLLILLQQYEKRIAKFPEVNARLSLLLEDPQFVRDIYRVMMQIQFSRLTDTISSKMRHDIIPTILKSAKFKRTQFGIEEIDDYLTKNGENPEWHHNVSDEKAQKKIDEMTELQMEGADVYMSTFSYMKGYPFFQTMSHWFTPFSKEHPSVRSFFKDKGSIVHLLTFAPFCNSDKFSICLMTDSLGATARETLTRSMESQMSSDELTEQIEAMKKDRSKPKAKDISRAYIFDLYRFFSLYPYHPQFQNPFAKELPVYSPTNYKLFTPLLQHSEEVLPLAEFFMRRGFYKEAIDLFLTLHPQPKEDDADIWQKIGFCHQKNGDLESAFKYYSTAFELKSTSGWTLKHLAQVAFQLKRYTEAEAYYDLLLDSEPENQRYLNRKIDCFIQTDNYEAAIPLLYKATYLDDENVELKDKLAWCQLLTGNTDKAVSLYNSLTDQFDATTSHPDVMMHAAAAMLVAGELKSAYSYFLNAYHQYKHQEHAESLFKHQFVALAKTLKELGIDVSRTEMLYDAVRIGLN